MKNKTASSKQSYSSSVQKFLSSRWWIFIAITAVAIGTYALSPIGMRGSEAARLGKVAKNGRAGSAASPTGRLSQQSGQSSRDGVWNSSEARELSGVEAER